MKPRASYPIVAVLNSASWTVASSPAEQSGKEIELGPTADGELVVDAHRRLHEEMALGMHDFLRRYSIAELQVLAKMLRDLQAATKVGVRIVVGDEVVGDEAGE